MTADFEPAENLYDNYLRGVIQKVESGYINRLNPQEYSEWKERYKAQRKIIKGELPFDRDRYNRSISAIKDSSRYVTFANPHEMMWLFSTEILEVTDLDFFIHECQHLNAARDLGFVHGYIGFFYYEGGGGEIYTQFFTHPGIAPHDLSDSQVVEALRVIHAAPSNLSNGDRYVLGF